MHCFTSSTTERTSAEMQRLSGIRTCTWALMHADTRRCIQIHLARRFCCHCAYTGCTWQLNSHSHLLNKLASFTGQEKRSAAILKTLPFMQRAMHSVQSAACSAVGGGGPRDIAVCFSLSFSRLLKKTSCRARKKQASDIKQRIRLNARDDLGTSQHLCPTDEMWGLTHAAADVFCYIWLLD